MLPKPSQFSTAETRTDFAPAERAPREELEAFVRAHVDDPIINVVLHAVGGFVVVLNDKRQVIAANEELVRSLGLADNGFCLIGLRPGEVFSCKHFTQGPAGCGTSVACRTCGAVISILESQKNDRVSLRECRLAREFDGRRYAAEFRVRASPIRVANHDLTVVVMHDISDEKRREVLESLFFRDAVQILTGLKGWSRLAKMGDMHQAAEHIVALSDHLHTVLAGHQRILAAERGHLDVARTEIAASAILDLLHSRYGAADVAAGKELVISDGTEDLDLQTDAELLVQVISAMLDNALEATRSGGSVQIAFESRGGRPTFSVHNDGVIPEVVQLRLFERYFTTKVESGRGLGTYAMKLLGEELLGGEVSFTSTPESGTTFVIELPIAALGTTVLAPTRSRMLKNGSTQGSVLALSPERRAELRDAAARADWDRLLAICDQIAEHDSELAGTLRGMAEDFAYEAIADLAEEG